MLLHDLLVPHEVARRFEFNCSPWRIARNPAFSATYVSRRGRFWLGCIITLEVDFFDRHNVELLRKLRAERIGEMAAQDMKANFQAAGRQTPAH